MTRTVACPQCGTRRHIVCDRIETHVDPALLVAVRCPGSRARPVRRRDPGDVLGVLVVAFLSGTLLAVVLVAAIVKAVAR